MGDVGILGSDIEARYEDDKDRKYKRGRNKRRYRNVLQKVVTPLLLLASFFLPFSFLLISERGTRLPSNARSYTIEKPLIKEDSLRIASTASKGSRYGNAEFAISRVSHRLLTRRCRLSCATQGWNGCQGSQGREESKQGRAQRKWEQKSQILARPSSLEWIRGQGKGL